MGSLWMVVASLGFALMGYFVKICSQYFDYQEIVFWRMLFATIVLILIASARGQSIKTPYLKGHIIRGLVGTIALILYFYLITYLPLATAVTLSYTSVIWFIIFSFFILKQRVSPLVLLCAIIGLIGVALLVQPTFSQGQIGITLVGILTGAISALAYIQVKELTLLKEPEWRIVFYFSLIGTIVTGIWSLFSGFHSLTLENFAYILAMGASALVGQMCMTLAYSKGDLFISSILSYLTIVFSFLIGFFILGDQLSVKEGMGILLVIASGVMSSVFNQKKQKPKKKLTYNH
ncbi:EamA family transporter [Neisseriaceae bacterium PsAf]|nr:EamA family transporter [Neisseriaceae bacterium PsAf]MCV2503574.1 DMT family transporter [Neisseriaceae bacterium]